MRKLSVMSRAELVCELIDASPSSTVADGSAAYAATRDPYASSACDALVSRKLSIAREILLRDLSTKMKATPVMSSPNAVREWLKLHCANLEHEVFIVLHLDVRNCLIDVE